MRLASPFVAALLLLSVLGCLSSVSSPSLGYGMQVDPGTDYVRSLGLLREAGFNWVKVQLRWEELEAQRGQIDWPLIDTIVREADEQGVDLLLSVVTAPSWARPAGADLSVPGPPADPADYASFLSAVIRRHRGKVDAIEVWNEQNLRYEWGGREGKLSATDYMDLLKASYAAIKATDPEVIVVSGAPTPTGVDDGITGIDDVRYLQMMYAAGLKEYSDAIGAHSGGYNNPPDDTPTVGNGSSTGFKDHWSFYYRRFEQYLEVMKRYGDGKKKLWFTELGWASSLNPPFAYVYARDNSEEDQAKYLVRAFQIAKEKGYIGAIFVWNLNYGPSAEPEDPYAKGAFSLLRPDWSPRPAYEALKAMPK